MAMRSMLQIFTYTRGSWCNNMELFASRRSGYDPLTLPTSSPGGACRHPWRIVQGPCPPLPSDGTVEPLSNTSQVECPSSATVRWQPSIHTCGSLLLTPPMMVTIGSKHNGSCDRRGSLTTVTSHNCGWLCLVQVWYTVPVFKISAKRTMCTSSPAEDRINQRHPTTSQHESPMLDMFPLLL